MREKRLHFLSVILWSVVSFALKAQSVTLAWQASPSPDVTYVVYYGTASGDYINSVGVGTQTLAKVDGLVSGQTYFFAVRAKDSGGGLSVPSNEASYAVPPVVTVVLIPPPWQTADVGAVALAGSAVSSNNIITVKGAGSISARRDSFRFVDQPLSDDGDISARINSLTDGLDRRVGVMIRETLADNSKYVFAGIGQDGRFRVQVRSKTSNRTEGVTSVPAAPPDAWVRVTRVGDGYSCYWSTNGTAWVRITSAAVAMTANVSAGLVVASGSPYVLEAAEFSDVRVTP